MRISDWSSDVCSSDLQIAAHKKLVSQSRTLFGTEHFDHYDFLLALSNELGGIGLEHHRSSENGVPPEYFTGWNKGPGRSEEHKSEIQSLMRISYAVFCLKKKTNTHTRQCNTNTY